MNLALLEVQADQNDAGIKDFRHGLSIYKKPADMFRSYQIQGLLHPIPIAKALILNGDKKSADTLIQETQAVANATFEYGSYPSVALLSDLTIFYFMQNRQDDAFTLLDQILSINLRNAELGQSSPLGAVADYADSIAKPGTADLRLKIFRKILTAQRKQFDSDDGRIASTLVHIAKAQDALGQLKEAEATMLEAVAIFKLYTGVPRVVKPCYELIEIWKKMGKTAEAKLVSAGYFKASPALLRRNGQGSLADKLEKDGKLPDDYIDAEYPHEHNRVIYDRTAPRSEQIEALQTEYKAACGEAPYSPRAISSLTLLMQLARAEQNWNLLLDVSAARVKQYEHSSDQYAGRSYGCVPPDSTRIQYYTNAALACIHLDKIDEAQNWLERGVKNMPEPRCYELIKIAELMFDCDNKAAAEKYTALSEPGFNSEYIGLAPWELENMWKKLGHPERAAAVDARYKELKIKHDEQMKNAQTSPFKYVQF